MPQATQITMQRAMNPSPCAQPKTIVSVSNPGTSQKTISPLKIASSIHEIHLTQVKSGPGTGFPSGLLMRRKTVAHSSHCARHALQTVHYGPVIMEAMAKNWTDERLEERFDAIDKRFDEVDRRFDAVDRRLDSIDRRFDAVDRRFEGVEAEIRDLRGDMKAGFDRMDERFDKVNERFEAMHRLMVQGGIVVVAALLGLIGTQL